MRHIIAQVLPLLFEGAVELCGVDDELGANPLNMSS